MELFLHLCKGKQYLCTSAINATAYPVHPCSITSCIFISLAFMHTTKHPIDPTYSDSAPLSPHFHGLHMTMMTNLLPSICTEVIHAELIHFGASCLGVAIYNRSFFVSVTVFISCKCFYLI